MAPEARTQRNAAAQDGDLHRPRQTISWRAAFVLSLGGALLVTVALGAMAAELGAASLLVGQPAYK